MNDVGFKLILYVAVAIGIVHCAIPRPTSSDVYPVFNNSIDDLKKLEYFNAGQANVRKPNCIDYTVHHEYILLQNGSLFLPGQNSVHDYNSYTLENDTVLLCGEDTASEDVTETDVKFSKEFLSCGHILIEPEEYQLLENGQVYIEIYSMTYAPGDYFIQVNGVYVCIPMFDEMKQNISTNATFHEDEHSENNKFPIAFTYVTYIGLSVSIISLMAHLVVFCVVSSVRNLPGCCLASLSLSLLVAYSCFLSVELADSVESCAALGMCVYYFFLTSFFWMNAIAFDVWRSFRVVMRELRISSHRVPWRRFLMYSLYSWTIPGALTVLVKVFDDSEVLPDDFRPSFGRSRCWFEQRKALLVFFAVPLIVVMVLNAIFFLDVTYVISRASLKTSQTNEANLKKRFFMFMRLALIMGLTWIVGLVAGYADNVVMWYIFIILNTLQGLFIFVVFSCSAKVRGLFFNKYRRRNTNRGSTSVRTISQISGTV